MPKKVNKRKSPVILMVLAGLGILLIAGSVAILAQPGSTGQVATPTPLAPVTAAEELPRISLEDAKAAFDNKAAIFLDVRSASAFASGHIDGAVSIPENEMPARLAELDPEAWIITYCT